MNVPSKLTLYSVLLLICISSVDNYFGYHAPSAIADEYESYYLLDTQEFGTLFTIYSLPNVVLVFFSGIFIDKYGLRLSSLLFNSCCLIGLLICALTPRPSSFFPKFATYVCLMIGRLFLGLGGESICACVSTMIAKWFTHSGHLNTATAINQAFVQLAGSSAAFFILPKLHSIIYSQFVVVSVSVICLLANLAYNSYESYYNEYLNYIITTVNNEEVIYKTDTVMNENNGCLILVNKNKEQINNYQSLNNPENAVEESSIIMILKSFTILFWIVLLHITCMSPILYTFTAFGPLYLQENFPNTSTPDEAGDAISLLYLAIITAPVSGMIIDYIGYRYEIQFVASSAIPLLCLCLSNHIIEPFLCLSIMGIMFSITEANGLAMIALVVPSTSLGAAYGLLGCSISMALLVEPALVGFMRERSGSFTESIWLFIAVTCVGSALALLLVLYTRVHKLTLS